MRQFTKATPMLKARDLQETVAFYVDVLGFTVDTLWPADAPTFAMLDHGAVTVCFDTTLWDGEPAMTGQILFDCDDVRALHGRIADRVEVLWGPQVYDYGRREFSIRDPNGYALVFSEPTDDPPTCEG
jgi:catechol 2,3-dioxygenase-like lactoylglutathione lyase family enzyme